MDAFEKDPLGQQLTASIPRRPSRERPPTADDLLRAKRRRSVARRCTIATCGTAGLWLLGVLIWTPPPSSTIPRIATSDNSGTLDPAPRGVTLPGQLAPSTAGDTRIAAEDLQPHVPREAVAPAAAIAPVVSDLPAEHEPIRVVWTDEESGQSVAIGYLRPARVRQLPMWQLPPAVQQEIRNHAAAYGDSLDPEI